MNSLASLFAVPQSCDQALEWLTRALSHQGLRVLQTFDLQDARLAMGDCPCPHHGTQACDCQMVVVLVYGKAAQPVSLVLHGSDGQTWVSLVNNPLQHADPSLQVFIDQAVRANPPEQNRQ